MVAEVYIFVSKAIFSHISGQKLEIQNWLKHIYSNKHFTSEQYL
jgi:hypothetical protein